MSGFQCEGCGDLFDPSSMSANRNGFYCARCFEELDGKPLTVAEKLELVGWLAALLGAIAVMIGFIFWHLEAKPVEMPRLEIKAPARLTVPTDPLEGLPEELAVPGEYARRHSTKPAVATNEDAQ